MPRRTSPAALLFVVGLAFFTDSILYYLLVPLLPHYARTLGLSQMEIGILFAAAALAHTLTSPLMGRLSDRVGRLRVMRVGFVLAALLIPVPAFLSTKWAVALSMAALGVTVSFVMSPVSPGLADAVEAMGSRSFGSVFSLVNVAYAVGMMVGPLADSALVEVGGIRVALMATGMVFALYLVPLGRLNPVAGPPGSAATLPPS